MVAIESPICWLTMWAPICSPANTPPTSMPISSPMLISPMIATISEIRVSGTLLDPPTACGTTFHTQNVIASPSSTFTLAGIERLEKKGTNANKPSTRKSTSRNGTSSGYNGRRLLNMAGGLPLCSVQGREQVPGIFQQPLEHPWHHEHHRNGHGKDFRDEREGLFLNLRDRLHQADDQPDRHPDDQNRPDDH